MPHKCNLQAILYAVKKNTLSEFHCPLSTWVVVEKLIDSTVVEQIE